MAAMTATGTKAAGTQKAALATPGIVSPRESPANVATIPAAAAPSAKPVCCTVATAEAARSPSPAFAPPISRWTPNPQHAPIPRPTRAIKTGRTSTGCVVIKSATPARPTAIANGPATSMRPADRSDQPETTIDETVQPIDAPATV